VSRIADRFGRAAGTYDRATPVQQQIAARLAKRVLEAGPPAAARVAEFGCGTGHLGRALAPSLQPALWIATDIAPRMAAKAGGLAAAMDASRPALKPGFDLVCSSLTLQWIGDGEGAVAKWRGLVAPGGLLAVATLTAGTFAEWRQAVGHEAGPAFPAEDEARGWFSPSARIERFTLAEHHPSALHFLRAAKAAGIDAGGGRALPAGTMRRAMRALEAAGGSISYRVLIAVEPV
jgi:malonyl-CoA O-methyltransferase